MAENISKSDKNYGLPRVKLTPIDRGQPGIAKVKTPTPRKQTRPKEKPPLVPILILITVSLIAVSLLYYFFWGSKSADDSTQSAIHEEQPALEETVEENPQAADETADLTPAAESEESVNEEVAAEVPGSIVTISERTGRYYIFLGSYKFKAYAQRHAEKLAADGFAVKLITPDNWVGTRVAVGNYASIAEADPDATFIEDKYGNDVVVSKY